MEKSWKARSFAKNIPKMAVVNFEWLEQLAQYACTDGIECAD
jgi:hypothetical protein